MNKEVQYISTQLQTTLDGEPWFGRPVYSILEEIDPAVVYKNPSPHPDGAAGGGHSIADLLYHMILWSEFTLKRLEKSPDYDEKSMSEMDWRVIDPAAHTWKKGIARFKEVNNQLISLLQASDDTLLKEKVDFREYNFRFLLHGIVQHHIYHLGQIAYVKKLYLDHPVSYCI
jgi:uncharacterized damage-inducible protein DinB